MVLGRHTVAWRSSDAGTLHCTPGSQANIQLIWHIIFYLLRGTLWQLEEMLVMWEVVVQGRIVRLIS